MPKRQIKSSANTTEEISTKKGNRTINKSKAVETKNSENSADSENSKASGDTVPKKRKAKLKAEDAKDESEVTKTKTSDDNVKQADWKFPHSQKHVGAHCSIQGGLHKAVEEALSIGGRAFGLFLKSQRQWASKPLEDKTAEKFKAACQKHGYSPNFILPHGSYLMNCGSPNEETLEKSRQSLIDELQRCEKLDIALYNFHPGSTCKKISVEECIEKIADSINKAHKATSSVTTVIENMSCQGSTIGGKFEELRDIIEQVEDKSRIGVCLDTCHAFAAGFDLSSEGGFDKMMKEFDEIVGLKYLKAMHLNDSKGKLGSKLDRHENIGKGFIGKRCFQQIMNDPRLDNLPLIIETPVSTDDTDAEEIEGLYKMCSRS